MTNFAIEGLPFDICPRCEAIFPDNLYHTTDIFSGINIYRCKVCHIELEKSNIGWVERK